MNTLIRSLCTGCIGLLVLICLPAGAQVKLPGIFGDHMVLQAKRPVPLWGWTAPGGKVTVRWRGRSYVGRAGDDGKWLVKLKACTAGGPYELSVMGAGMPVVLHDVLVGDVWLASGQSNMEFGIQTDSRAARGIATATDTLIRLFYVPMEKSDTARVDIGKAVNEADGKWVVCSPSLMAAKWAWHGFSAVGYYFARHIRSITGAPVGVIGSYKGGTPAQSWVRDGNYFNAMIHPLVPYAIKGVIWYQGESNGDRLADALRYDTLFPRLIRDWRGVWRQGNFPFLWVQLPNFRDVPRLPSEGNWPWVREAQLRALALSNTGMAVAIDLGTAKNIHPWNKSEVADRLALAARQVVYGEKLDHSGPVYKGMRVEGHSIRLFFRKGADLTAAHRDSSGVEPRVVSDTVGVLKGFAVAGEDRHFVWARAVLYGNSILVSAGEVARPVAVRYDWADNPEGNLYDVEGLPASPFRTDRWAAEAK